MNTAVIGAGMAGLCAAKHALQNGLNVTVFDIASSVGGTWVYSDEIGKDKYGLEVHSSMYKGLHTNLPKEIMGYPDYPIPPQEKSYIPAADIFKFLDMYASHFNVIEHIKFRHYVIRVTPRGTTEWEVLYKNLETNQYSQAIFDAVIVCNGHYNSPLVPNIPGKSIFKGHQLHSHDYRYSDGFKDETVLVIGAGPSGIDIAYDISKVAKRVTLSQHLPTNPEMPKNIDLKPDVLRLTENGAIFINNCFESYSVIMYCTGYKYTFPFLSVDCGISVEDNYVRPLFKHCININHPTMAFIGLPFKVCASQMFDLQVRFTMKFLSGKKMFPSKIEMLIDTDKEMQLRWIRGYKHHQAHLMGREQRSYYDDLANTADIEKIKPVIVKLHEETGGKYRDDLVNFRKDVYKIIDDETFIKN